MRIIELNTRMCIKCQRCLGRQMKLRTGAFVTRIGTRGVEKPQRLGAVRAAAFCLSVQSSCPCSNAKMTVGCEWVHMQMIIIRSAKVTRFPALRFLLIMHMASLDTVMKVDYVCAQQLLHYIAIVAGKSFVHYVSNSRTSWKTGNVVGKTTASHNYKLGCCSSQLVVANAVKRSETVEYGNIIKESYQHVKQVLISQLKYGADDDDGGRGFV